MATSEATIVDAGGRELRVSSPDRVIFPRDRAHAPRSRSSTSSSTTSRSSDGIMRALARPADDARALAEGRAPGHRRSRRARRAAATRSSRSASRKGAPDYVETARIEFPSGRHADEICPTEIAVVGWAAQMGTITFHPWPVRGDDVDHPDELRIDLDPQPGTDFADAVRVAAEARDAARRPRLRRLPEDLGRPRRAHLRADRAALDVHRRPPRRDRVRPRARAAAARAR